MRFLASAIVLSFFAVFAAASPVPQSLNPQPLPPGFDPSKVGIEAVSYAGSGCKAGSVAISPSQDWTVVTLAFDSYIASIGPGIPFVERRKNCNINFRLHYPQGYSFALYKTDYIGRVDLQDRVNATQESNYWFAGHPPPPPEPIYSRWTGPINENYHLTDTLVGSALVWSPCGASTTFNVNTQVYLDSSDPTKSGFITTDVIDNKVKTLLGIQWQQCH